MSKTESICYLGDDFGVDYSWNRNQPFQIVLDLVSFISIYTMPSDEIRHNMALHGF
jgi:hypothetical protein